MTALTRRRLLELAAAGGAAALSGCASSPATVRTPGRLRHAGVGTAGMGAADLEHFASHGAVDVVALCDVDAAKLEEAAAKYPGARLYRDWREMLAREHDAIDSVSVSIPDHMHAPVTLEALARRKHVYCQKPLTRTVDEARAVARAARRAGVATQMGIQNHSNPPLARAKALFDAGHVGPVYEVHVWTDRPRGWWPQGCDRMPGEDAVPETLDWDLWLGVAPHRPYKEGQYHPFAWRGWKDFGTGAQGDMGCHLMDAPVWFLELDAPLSLRSDGPAPNAETYPLWSRVDYEFPANRHTTRGPLRFTWHDGGRQPYRELLDALGAPAEIYANGFLFLGTEGAMLASPYDPPILLPEERFAGVEVPEVRTPSHWHQWVDACRGEGECSAGFEYSAHMTEIVLLGNVALHLPHETLRWDGARGRFRARPEADALLSAPYRAGWG